MQLCGREIGSTHPLFLITGNCVIESEESALRTAAEIAHIAERTGILTIYKSSFDKANRTAHDSFRGPGLEEGLRILERVRADSGLPVLTDVHEEAQVRAAADDRRRAAGPRLPVAPNRPARRRGKERAAAERKEGPVHGAAGHYPARS